MGKPFNKPEEYQSVLARLHRLGIRVIGAFVFGDEDNPSTIAQTVRWVHKAKVDLVQYTLAIPLPGTRLWQRVKERIIVHDHSKYGGRHVTIQNPNFSVEQIQRAFNRAYRRTYSWLSIFRRLFPPRGDWTTFVALNLAFRRGTYGWMTHGD